MAMQLATDLNNGFTGNYWRIFNIRINKDTKMISIDLSLYIDKAGRAAGRQPVSYASYVISGADFTAAMTAANLTEGLYAWVKLQPQFTGEVDC